MITEEDKKAIEGYFSVRFKRRRLTEEEQRKQREDLAKSLSEDVTSQEVFCRWLRTACEHRDGEGLNWVTTLGWELALFSRESVEILEKISLENWVLACDLENMVGLIEDYGGEEKVKSLAAMAVQKYPDHYLGDNDEYIARKAMWALHRLYTEEGNTEALETIKELSQCGDPMVEGYAKHHLEKFGIK